MINTVFQGQDLPNLLPCPPEAQKGRSGLNPRPPHDDQAATPSSRLLGEAGQVLALEWQEPPTALGALAGLFSR